MMADLLFQWLTSLSVCVSAMCLNLPIRGFQCYSHPDKEKFTISEIEEVL